MTLLIGIAGKLGVGKDTVADYLWEQRGFAKIAFADPLRAAASSMFGVAPEFFIDREKKEQVLDYWGMSPRRMLQLLGNDAVKPVFGVELWAKRWLLSYNLVKETDDVVVPDVRFDLEAALIRRLGGVVVRLERSTGEVAVEVASHISENGLSPAYVNTVIENNGSKDELFERVEEYVWSLY